MDLVGYPKTTLIYKFRVYLRRVWVRKVVEV